eukprot:207550_1
MKRQNMEYQQSMMQQQHNMEMKRDEQQQKLWQDRLQQEAQQKAQIEKEMMEQKKRAQQDWLQKQRQLNEENLQRKQKIEEQIEMKRRESMDYQAKLDRDTAKIRVREETEGKMKIERENEDIHLRKNKLNLEENRKTTLEIRKEELLAYTNLVKGIKDLMTDSDKLKVMGTAIIGITAGVVGIKRGINLCAKQIEKRWGKPSLIRETSRWSFKDFQPKKSWLSKQGRYQSSELKKRINSMN